MTDRVKNKIEMMCNEWSIYDDVTDLSIIGDFSSLTKMGKLLSLYKDFASYGRLQRLLAKIHNQLNETLSEINQKYFNKGYANIYIHADVCKQLIWFSAQLKKLFNILQGTEFQLRFADDIDMALRLIDLFKSSGTTIPDDIDEFPVFTILPIFILDNKIIVPSTKIETITHDYIRSISERTKDDFASKNYDSVLTKCKTMLDTIFIFGIEKKNEKPDKDNLFGQFKSLYNMIINKSQLAVINDLLNGLNKIHTAIGNMRNDGGDAHTPKLKLNDLFLNAAITLADFYLSIIETRMEQ